VEGLGGLRGATVANAMWSGDNLLQKVAEVMVLTNPGRWCLLAMKKERQSHPRICKSVNLPQAVLACFQLLPIRQIQVLQAENHLAARFGCTIVSVGVSLRQNPFVDSSSKERFRQLLGW